MHPYIEKRIKQNPYNPEILPMSTPVICFGDLYKSNVATLGLNPSDKEFVDDNKIFLEAGELRFQNCFSLSQNDLTQLNANQTELVLQYCLEYFNNENPYRVWFNKLEDYVLSNLDISYYNGTCCHLDLVQWATSKKWRNVLPENQSILIDSDYPFLLHQLENQNIELLLVNGNGVYQALMNKGEIRHEKKDIIICGTETCRMNKFIINTGTKNIIGIAWSKNLQSSKGLTNIMRYEIGNWIKKNL